MRNIQQLCHILLYIANKKRYYP